MTINSILLLSIGLVSFSRLYLKAHNYGQILAGIATGFLVMYTIVFNQWYI
jgi:membrane-associated phospholipid phosphatase